MRHPSVDDAHKSLGSFSKKEDLIFILIVGLDFTISEAADLLMMILRSSAFGFTGGRNLNLPAVLHVFKGVDFLHQHLHDNAIGQLTRILVLKAQFSAFDYLLFASTPGFCCV
ncbi:hypothetical protein HPP92_013392 [Vanilla planifolia]|uniref:Uncharacterized protein n=1 Tax=Vanilla planifolia TaxID=51239 RepID=A0A835UZ01_VANPL|nr:hypothetical protein HPP92_013822 [Vanilla planifolia]KAG0478673.1 hypothetical protein HPP92_013392 [Vanilla planifolia]